MTLNLCGVSYIHIASVISLTSCVFPPPFYYLRYLCSLSTSFYYFYNYEKRACVMTAGDPKSALLWRWCNCDLFSDLCPGLIHYLGQTTVARFVHIRFPVDC